MYIGAAQLKNSRFLFVYTLKKIQETFLTVRLRKLFLQMKKKGESLKNYPFKKPLRNESK